MKIFITALVLFLTSFSAAVHAQEDLKAFTYSVSFKIKNAGITVDGSFKDLQASIQFSPDQLESSKIIATVEINTINTGNNTRDNHLRSDDYFDVTKYPNIRLSSTRFFRKNDSFSGYFNLTIKDVTKQVEIPFTYSVENGQATFDGQLTIDRRDYHVGGFSLILSDEVNIHILVNAKK